MKETHKRSIIKSFSWRITASFVTFLLVFIYTSNISISLQIGALEFIFKMLIYYIHERFWLKITWGIN